MTQAMVHGTPLIRRGKNGFTLIEIMLALALMLLVAALLMSKLSTVTESTELLTARQQSMDLQTALDSWLNSTTLAGARQQFNPSNSASLPADTSAFLESHLKPWMGEATQELFQVSETADDHIETQLMKAHGWYLRIIWDGSDWINSQPRIEVNIEEV